MCSDDIVSLLFDHSSRRWRVGSVRIKCMNTYSDDIVSLLFDHGSPRWRVGSARIFKFWLLIAWKCIQMTLYLYYLIIGAPVVGWVVPEILKIGF